MKVSVRVTARLSGLSAKLRAAIANGLPVRRDPDPRIGLPSTSALRRPADIAAIGRFGAAT